MVVVPRAPTPTIEQQEIFRPIAAPVDTYIRAPDPAPSDLHNLAKGLENFSRDIRGMFQAREARDEEAARIRGEAQFFQDNQIGYAEAVRTGKIPAFQSRPFMQAYKEAEGKVIGARLASQMQLEYQTWEGRNTQDPTNFDQFMAQFLKRNLTQDDPDVLKGAMPYIYQTVNAGYTQRTQDAADATYNGGLNAQVAVSTIAIDEFSDNLSTDYDALWEELIANRGSALATGLRTLDYDSKLIDAIAAKALEGKDPALLALLDRPLPGQDAPISATPYGREVKARTISAMETINSQADNAAYTAQQRRDKALNDELTAFAVEAIFADPDVVLPDNFWAAYAKVEPEARVKIQELRNAAIKGIQEDPELVSDLTYRILVDGEDPLTILRTHGDALDGSTVVKLYEMSRETPTWQSSQAYKIGLQTIQAKANEGNDLAINPNYVSPAASAASMDFELSMRAWAKTPAGAEALKNNDAAAIATEVGRVQGIIMGGFDSSMSEQATYAVPEEIVDIREQAGMAANPLAPTQRALDEAAAADAAYAASPEGQMPEWTSGQVPNLNSLPDEEQRSIREEADRRGIDPQIFLEETYRQVDAILQEVEANSAIEQGIQNILGGNIPSPEVSQGPNMAPWRDWISGNEGTAGDYNETFGYGRFAGGDVDLSQMTIQQVSQLQRQMLADPGNTWGSSAVGKYQIVNKTLEDLVTTLGIDRTELFTPELQDRLADALLERRGFSDWQAGKLSDEAFSKNLASEWVSTEGKSLPMAREEVRQFTSAVSTGPNADITMAGLQGPISDDFGIGAAIDAAMRGGDHLSVAARYLNLDERNSDDARTLAEFFQKASGNSLDPSTTAWCAAFVNAVLGSKNLGGTGSNLARSFLNYGQDVTGTPQRGDIIVFPRGNSNWQGHVGFIAGTFEKGGETWVKVLGGNQSTQESGSRGVTVNVKEYRLADALGVRRPAPNATMVASN